MNRNAFVLGFFALVAPIVSPALLRAQGPPPGGPPPFGGGFGRGRGFRVLGVEGCLANGRRVPAGTPGFAAQVTRTELEPVLNGSPVTRTNTYESYRDNSGVTYQQITLPPMGGSGASRTVICISDPTLRIHLVVDPARMTARQFPFPPPPSWANGSATPNGGAPPPWPNGNGGNRPTPPGVTVTHPAPPSSIAGEIATYCPAATTTLTTRSRTVGGAAETSTNERVFCPTLFVELYSQSNDPHRVSTTTATITATGTGVNLASLSVPYPLPGSYAVTVVTPRKRDGPTVRRDNPEQRRHRDSLERHSRFSSL